MKLWLLEQNENNDFDTFDSCVVVAETEYNAKQIHPDGESIFKIEFDSWSDSVKTDWFKKDYENNWFASGNTWASNPSKVKATYIGEAEPNLVSGTVICASFNAG